MQAKASARVLIVNRGEIAERAQQACRRLGLATVLFCTPADRLTIAAELAESLWLAKENDPQSTYLSLKTIEQALQETGATALYPGYGFLSESADLALLCEKLKVTFIGPPSDALQKLAHKGGARELAKACQIPTLALSPPFQQTDFPILLKAAHGGGGRGHTVVQGAGELPGAEASLRERAKRLFNSDALLHERYLPESRHVELQIFTKSDGETLFLGTRDCTVQRNFQKIIEEGPALSGVPLLLQKYFPALSDYLRSVRYLGPGTLEFLCEPLTQKTYFLEMNCRIQVEHTVTEENLGCDLVQAQIANALSLPLPVWHLENKSHAMQMRIYAEEPTAGYRPSTGKICFLELPREPFARFDMSYSSGHEISPFYDPLIGKLIVRGSHRAECIARSLELLKDLTIHGVQTNIEQLKMVLRQEEFRENKHSTLSLGAWMQNFHAVTGPPLSEKFILKLQNVLASKSERVIIGAKDRVWKNAHRK